MGIKLSLKICSSSTIYIHPFAAIFVTALSCKAKVAEILLVDCRWRHVVCAQVGVRTLPNASVKSVHFVRACPCVKRVNWWQVCWHCSCLVVGQQKCSRGNCCGSLGSRSRKTIVSKTERCMLAWVLRLGFSNTAQMSTRRKIIRLFS